ncbi:glycosyltransferase family 4 protein [Segetibacter sp. 3557_3]|uniref:glycosyltransferase family 4 protein n=1 Tax=Segetibacter sp. 3557_3 TaxID=2547429 RepID=UPI001405543B|nr:glycosyltransferase family 1 protein [Segetibacter sp. 3557_3]
MDKLRIGIIVDHNAVPTEGGGYTYYQTLLHTINHYDFYPEIEIINIVFSKKAKESLPNLKQTILIKKDFAPAVMYTAFDVLYRVWYRTVRKAYVSLGDSIMNVMDGIRNKCIINVLKKENIDMVYYLRPVSNIIDYPAIITHWDVGHKSMYPFPEVADKANFKKRETYYISMVNKAFLILCESQAGIEELLNYYPINPEKVKMLPLFSGEVVKQEVSETEQQAILSQIGLVKGSFFLYPAQFWAHKNHYNLVKAFFALTREPGGEQLKLVLCGSDKGNLRYIKKLVESLGLTSRVLFPGFISYKALYSLYKNAVAMIMPTFLGPTNIPLIEAAKLGCPVLCTALKGHKEIMGNAALYFNPSEVESIKAAMQQVLQEQCRQELVAAGYERMRVSFFDVEKSVGFLQKLLLQIKPIRKAWGIE